MTWQCPSCGRRYPDSSLGLPNTADADQMFGCVKCIDAEEPGFGPNGVELVVGMIDYTERDMDGMPMTYWSKYPMSIHELSRMDNRDFWETAIQQMSANIIATYREGETDDFNAKDGS